MLLMEFRPYGARKCSALKIYQENHIVTSSLRKRFTECVVCRTTVIFPGLPGNKNAGETNDVRHCPVCGYGFSVTEIAVSGQSFDDKQLEEFFAQFS
jgi:hypothetical protein